MRMDHLLGSALLAAATLLTLTQCAREIDIRDGEVYLIKIKAGG